MDVIWGAGGWVIKLRKSGVKIVRDRIIFWKWWERVLIEGRMVIGFKGGCKDKNKS